MKKLEKRVKRYLPVELDVDTSYLNNTQVNGKCVLEKYVALYFSLQEQVLESLINAASYMDDIFEIQVEFNFLKALFVQLQTTVGDCRYLDALINNHETGVERFQEQERTPGG